MTSSRKGIGREEVFHWLIYFLVRCLICAIQAFPLRRASEVASGLAFVCGDLLKIRGKVVDENLRHAFPDWTTDQRRRAVSGMWKHLFLLGIELIQAQRRIHRSNWRDWVEIPSEEKRRLVRLMLDDRALVAVTAHFGNFEMCGYVAGLLGFPTYTLARPLDNPPLDRYLTRLRERTGQVIFSARGTAELAQAVLEEHGTLALLGDQHAGPKGCWVDFFGRPASCHKSISVFSLANKIPLAVIFATRLAGQPLRFQLRLVGEFDPLEPGTIPHSVPDLTQWYNHLLERYIREKPDQYWWLHRRWKAMAPRPTRRRATASAV